MRATINHPELFAAVFESITKSKLHRPVNGLSTDSREIKKGDLYSLNYNQLNKTLSLSLNQKPLGSITDQQANQYFKIWFGSSPFNAKLKQQLLNQ